MYGEWGENWHFPNLGIQGFTPSKTTKSPLLGFLETWYITHRHGRRYDSSHWGKMYYSHELWNRL